MKNNHILKFEESKKTHIITRTIKAITYIPCFSVFSSTAAGGGKGGDTFRGTKSSALLFRTFVSDIVRIYNSNILFRLNSSVLAMGWIDYPQNLGFTSFFVFWMEEGSRTQASGRGIGCHSFFTQVNLSLLFHSQTALAGLVTLKLCVS
jgi:hypothetical protein